MKNVFDSIEKVSTKADYKNVVSSTKTAAETNYFDKDKGSNLLWNFADKNEKKKNIKKIVHLSLLSFFYEEKSFLHTNAQKLICKQ